MTRGDQNLRKERKDEHIENYLQTEYVGDSLLGDVYLEPRSFPEVDMEAIDTGLEIFGKRQAIPLMINAMTGGTEVTRAINESLARIAGRLGLPVQVGSMRIALDDPSTIPSFRVVRDIMGPQGVVLANLGAEAEVDEVGRVMELIDADGIGIHLNAHQEAVMEEGERDFRSWKTRVRAIAEAFPGKVIVKQVGLGMDREALAFLEDLPLAYVDISGLGGTNFFEIEDLRRLDEDFTEFYTWGIPTAKAILNAKAEAPSQKIIASGGIRTASDLVRAMVLGADMGAISGEILRFLLNGDEDYTAYYLAQVADHFRIALAFMGCQDLEDLHRLPYQLTGELARLVEGKVYRQ